MNIEILEARIAPAVLVNPANHRLATYTDMDGDQVTIKVSAGDLTTGVIFNSVASGLGEQLKSITFTDGFEGADLTVSVKKSATGDGLANVGEIQAGVFALGKVTIAGDLGAIDLGNLGGTRSLESLSVHSLGLFGLATGAPDLESYVMGTMGSLSVTTDVKDAYFHALAIGSVKIGGNLLGGTLPNSGSIQAGTIGAVQIGGNVIGDYGARSGVLICKYGSIGDVSIGGSVVGGLGFGDDGTGTVPHETGAIIADYGGVGAVTIGGDLRAGANTFTGYNSGLIRVKSDIKSLTIGGSFIGGPGDQSYDSDPSYGAIGGQVYAGGNIGPVKIGHDLVGGAGIFSGTIGAKGMIGLVTVGGSVLGGSNLYTGIIDALGDITGVKIGHDIIGGTGSNSGEIISDGSLGAVTVGGSLVGGGAPGANADGSGVIYGHIALGPVKIGHDVLGGGESGSGLIQSTYRIASVTIGGSVVGGSGDYSGCILLARETGTQLSPFHEIGPIKIGGNLQGTSLSGSARQVLLSGFIQSYGTLGSIAIGGSILAGLDDGSNTLDGPFIFAAETIKSLTVKGSIAGNHTGNDLVTVKITAGIQGAQSHLAIGKLTVGGRVEDARLNFGIEDPDVQVGAITVGGDWIASDLVAGAKNTGAADSFGDEYDTKVTLGTDDADLHSRLASISIGGQVFGSTAAEGTMHFGFVAEQIGAFKVGGHAFALHSGLGDDELALNHTSNVSLHEIGAHSANELTLGPATLVNASTVTYFDRDGDRVTVKLSQSVLTDANVNSVFKFDAGTVGDGISVNRQLQGLDLAPLATPGLGVSVTVKRGINEADGVANIGYISAPGMDLGTISIAGDLGQLDAGSGSATVPAVKSLNVRTLGRLGLDTQPAAGGGFTPDLESSLDGSLGSLTVAKDLLRAKITITDGTGTNGKIGSVKIGGSLLEGSSSASDGIGAVSIRGDLVGGKEILSGTVNSNGDIGNVTIGGSLLGGDNLISGGVLSGGSIGAVKIGGDLAGGLTLATGRISANTSITSVNLRGSLLGGEVTGAGEIASGGSIGTVTIGHNLHGGTGASTARLTSVTTVGKVSVGGSILGGSVFAGGTLSTVKIGHDVIGGTTAFAGSIRGDSIAALTVSGSVIGGTGDHSGLLMSTHATGAVKIGHDLLGGTNTSSGLIEADSGLLKSVTIGGSIIGGTGNSTGGIRALGALGAVKIGRDVQGGSNFQSATFSLSGFIVAGIYYGNGSGLLSNGTIRSDGVLAAASVKGSLIGHTTISGTTLAIISASGGNVAAGGSIAIGKLTVGGTVSFTNIEAGYTIDLAPVRGSAQIGAIKVAGDWLASNAIAGAQNYGTDDTQGGGNDNLNFGNSQDHIIGASQSFSKIASIIISGIVAGTPSDASSGSTIASDHFGFVAAVIGKFQSAGFKAALAVDELGETIPLIIATADVTIHELG